MIKIFRLVATLIRVVDTIGVEDKRFVTGIDGNANRSLIDESGLQSSGIVWCHVDVAVELSTHGSIVKVAIGISLQVRTVRLFGGDTAVLDDPIVGSEVLTTIAAVVAKAPRAVDQILST